MATLSENIDATAALWTVSADVPDTTDYLQVDSEIVRVRAQFPGVTLRGNGEVVPPKIRVDRAAGGTTAASHLSGATLTPLIPPTSTGEQTIRLLGPFTVTFETEGVGSEEDGALITTLSAGQIVVGIGVVINNAGGFDANLGIYLGGSNYEAPDDEFSRLVLDVPADTGMVPSGAARTRYKIGISSGDVAGWSGAAFGILLTDGALVAQLSDVATQGEADIYALIAEPA